MDGPFRRLDRRLVFSGQIKTQRQEVQKTRPTWQHRAMGIEPDESIESRKAFPWVSGKD